MIASPAKGRKTKNKIKSAAPLLLLIVFLVIFDQFFKLSFYFLKIDWSLDNLISLRPALGNRSIIPFSSHMFLSCVLIAALAAILLFSGNKTIRYSATFLVAGGISNTLDRLYFSSSIDFIRIIDLSLNIADIYILIGSLAILYTFSKPLSLKTNKLGGQDKSG